MDSSVYNTLYKEGIEHNLPLEAWYPITMLESGGGNPFARGDGGNSYGLFQINKGIEKSTGRQMHADFDTSRLGDISYQADYFMPYLSKVYNEALQKGLTGLDAVLYTERYGERPAWNQNVINGITKHYNDITKGNVKPPTITTNPPSNSGTTTPVQNTGILGNITQGWVDSKISSAFNGFLFVLIIIIAVLFLGLSFYKVVE